MIKHFCDICGNEIDQKTERKNKQINNLKANEAETFPELKVLRKVISGDMVNYRGMDICSGCSNMLSDAVYVAMNDLRRVITTHIKDSSNFLSGTVNAATNDPHITITANNKCSNEETIDDAQAAFDGE